MILMLRKGATLQLVDLELQNTEDDTELALLRLGATLGKEGCHLADVLLNLMDESPADLGGAFVASTTSCKTHDNELFSPIADTRVVCGNHFNFLLDYAREITHVI